MEVAKESISFDSSKQDKSSDDKQRNEDELERIEKEFYGIEVEPRQQNLLHSSNVSA